MRAAPASPSCLPAPQESISDFYWYYSGKDVIEEQGKRNFSKAMSVAKQVFNSLTEYIQVGPGLGELPASATPAWGFMPPSVLRDPALGTSRVWRTAASGMPWWGSCTCSHT